MGSLTEADEERVRQCTSIDSALGIGLRKNILREMLNQGWSPGGTDRGGSTVEKIIKRTSVFNGSNFIDWRFKFETGMKGHQ